MDDIAEHGFASHAPLDRFRIPAHGPQCEALIRSTDKFGATPLDYVPPQAVGTWMAFLHLQVDVWWSSPPMAHQVAGYCPYVRAAAAHAAPSVPQTPSLPGPAADLHAAVACSAIPATASSSSWPSSGAAGLAAVPAGSSASATAGAAESQSNGAASLAPAIVETAGLATSHGTPPPRAFLLTPAAASGFATILGTMQQPPPSDVHGRACTPTTPATALDAGVDAAAGWCHDVDVSPSHGSRSSTPALSVQPALRVVGVGRAGASYIGLTRRSASTSSPGGITICIGEAHPIQSTPDAAVTTSPHGASALTAASIHWPVSHDTGFYAPLSASSSSSHAGPPHDAVPSVAEVQMELGRNTFSSAPTSSSSVAQQVPHRHSLQSAFRSDRVVSAPVHTGASFTLAH